MPWFRADVIYPKQTNWGLIGTQKYENSTVVIEQAVETQEEVLSIANFRALEKAVYRALVTWNSRPALDPSPQVVDLHGPYPSEAAARGAKPGQVAPSRWQ